MDDHRFDTWVRAWARQHSRRGLVRGLIGGGALLATARFGASDAAARGRSGAGDPCRHDDQCVAADTPLVCAWNGFGHDGGLNCCTFEGSRCSDDRGCCGLNTCDGGFCNSSGVSFSSAGNAGIATASSDGGFISIGDINSGGNVGNAISIGNTTGSVRVSGGSVSNVTDVSVSADAGMAIADASGGSGNIAGGSGGYYDSGGYYQPGDPCAGYPLAPGCGCWQGPYDDDPCAGSTICCRQAGDSNGVCLEIQTCTGWFGPGEGCPAYCGWGSGCPSCTTGYCNWWGYCDYPQ